MKPSYDDFWNNLAAGPIPTCLSLYFIGDDFYMIQQHDFIQPEQLNFKDDGIFPNSPLPLLFYRDAIRAGAKDPASIFEQSFAGMIGPTRGETVFIPFPIITARRMKCWVFILALPLSRLGGEHGKNVEVHAGDVIVIPAGVAHQNVGASNDFGVVGVYAGGRQWGFASGCPGRAPQSRSQYCGFGNAGERSIYGVAGPLREIWKSADGKSK